MKKALVLLSGGMDSAVCLFLAVSEHGADAVSAVFFDWGQRSLAEERSACGRLIRAAGIEPPWEITLDFAHTGPLTEPGAPVPSWRSPEEMDRGGAAPTFFPGRNLVMLAHACGLAAARGIEEVHIGANRQDAAGYPDCRPEFLDLAGRACSAGVGRDIRIVAPLLDMSKEEVARAGDSLGVPWRATFSCYAPRGGLHCGECDACVLRARSLGRDR